ncbi:MAG: hypothetical protein Q7W45_00980 [Bacteroidota bacterium]|nr:hypothetical protein [Bacteroidota bacterium]MDP3146672.1 hypothetical protein [Bacteroidota bacterium]
MEATTKIKLKSLDPYRHLFPAALVIDKTIKKGAGVSDTVAFIPKVVAKCRWQVKNYVDAELRGLGMYEACEKLWHFVKQHIEYEKDERGLEQVRSPRRLIHDVKGDCDCFTTFIDTCLTELNIPTINRITKYKENHFQHIYPIVPMSNGQYIVMDCVVDRFNYEEPYSEKKDYKMDLQFLDGIDDEKLNGGVDVQDLFGWDGEMGELGKAKIFRKNQSTSAMPLQNQGNKKTLIKNKGFQKFKTIAKKGLNIANKANPATALLRAGILASMKLNVMKVPQRLKWAYLTESEAQQKGADMAKFGKLKNVLYRIEQIFYTAGGKPENLKKAILEGRGNRNKEVNGFGYAESMDGNVSGMSEYTNVSTLLGTSIYQDEFVNGLEGTEGLGAAVTTSAAITAATTVMASIAALLKSIGNVFPNKKQSHDFNVPEENKGTSSDAESGNANRDNPTSENAYSENSNNSSSNSNASNSSTSSPEGNKSSSSNEGNSNSENVPANQNTNSEAGTNEDNQNNGANARTANTNTDTKTDDIKKGGFKEFWENNKKWMKPVGIGLGVAGILFAGYKALKKDDSKGSAKKSSGGLNGVPKNKKGKRKGRKKQQYKPIHKIEL